MKLRNVQEKLAVVFDDNLKTVMWKNILDYVIIFFILLSTAQVFFSTYHNLSVKYEKILNWIDYITIAFFTVEVSLRIWCAGVNNPRYKGWKGKIRYCLSFYGLIDILSTYPFYVSFFIKIPYSTLKILRLARIFRVFRYAKSFKILKEAFLSKKREMWISIQFLTIVTFILSLFLYFMECEAQPETFDNGLKSVAWAFAQYIGDPGGFADFTPITFAGRMVACMIGILGIAIFAVPAGLIGSAFIEVIEKQEKSDDIQNNVDRLHKAFRQVQCRKSKYFVVPKYITLPDLQAKYSFKENDIFEAIKNSPNFRLRNLATTISKTLNPVDKLAVEYFLVNRPYGYCIDRGSSVTIVSTSSYAEAAIGNFSYYLAKIGGFNYVSKEIEFDIDNPSSYYIVDKENPCPNFEEFVGDIKSMANSENHWVIFLLSASGGQEPVYPNDFHFVFGSKKGNESYEDQKLTINDTQTYDRMYREIIVKLQEKYDRTSDCQLYLAGAKNIAWHIHDQPKSPNAFTIRIAWSATCWDDDSYLMAYDLAKSFNEHFENQKQKIVDDSELKIRTENYQI